MPNRILRDYTDSIQVNELSDGAETFFIRLMMKADDYGKFHGNPKLLKANLYPLKDTISEKKIAEWIKECVKNGLIMSYSVNGRDYILIHRFGQRLRRMQSKYPDPNEVTENDSRLSALDRNPPPETETETETETEKKVKGRFTPPTEQEVYDYFMEIGVNGNETTKFWNYYESKGWMVGKNKMKNWKAACKNWKNNIPTFSTKEHGTGKQTSADRMDTLRDWIKNA